MNKAISLAMQAFYEDEVPVGAVIIKDNKIIGQGYNKKEQLKNPVCHAEIEAINEACKNINDWRLNGCDLYVTAEPCIMCAGAILHARISSVYFGVNEPKFGGVLSKEHIFDNNTLNHKVNYAGGIQAEEISEIMKKFFKKIRNK